MNKLLVVVIALSAYFTVFNSSIANAESNTIKNINGISISSEDYNRLISLGYENEDIVNMSEDEYNLNKGLTGEEMSIETKYIKTTYIYSKENNEAKYSINSLSENELLVESFDEELTEEQFEKELAAEENNDQYNTLGTDTGTKQTSYKLLTTKIIKLSKNKYRAMTTLNWRKMPKVRHEDIIGAGMRFPDNFTMVHTERYGTQSYKAKSYSGGWKYKSDIINYSASSGKWADKGYMGNALVMNLKNNFYSGDLFYDLYYLRLNTWYNFKLNNSRYSKNYVEIKGNYAHQVNSKNIRVNSISIQYGTPVITFGVGNDKDWYDNPIFAPAYLNYN